MILVLAGTKEGTQIISLLAEKGYKVGAIMATSYGTKMAAAIPGVEVVANIPNKDYFRSLSEEMAIKVIIDATHSLPNKLSDVARELCICKGIPYIRYLREELDLPENPLIHPVFSWEEAAVKAAKLGGTIFLTTGSNNLENFLSYEEIKGKRVVVRVLPDYKIVQKCQNLGLIPKDIVAMQGPFSREMNRQQFKMFNASVIIMKDSGKAGGTDTKISAALSLGIPVIVIKRKRREDQFQVTDYNRLLGLLKEIYK